MPVLTHLAGRPSRSIALVWGVGAIAKPALNINSGKSWAATTAREIKTGEAPATRGGNGKLMFLPVARNSASAIAVYWRSSGVAPAAEILGISPVAVKPSTQANTGRLPR